MHSTILSSDAATTNAPFKIVIIYENLAAGIRAQETAARLAREGNIDAEVTVNLWKFDLLGYSSMCQQAAQDAADADMLIVSADAHSKLPAHVRDWLENFMPTARRPEVNCALVALLGQDYEAPISWEAQNMRSYLQQIADSRGMDFFCKNDSAMAELNAVTREADLPVNTLIFLDETFTPDAGWQRWGIND